MRLFQPIHAGYVRLTTALLLAGLLSGCGSVPAAESAAHSPVLLPMYTPSPSPTAVPSPIQTASPDMVFEEDGDLYFSDAFAATFAARVFPFDHAPRVLIYHTHTREAFADTAQQATPAPDGTRARAENTDAEKNVVYLGTVLADALRERGFVVFHDETDNEPPALSTAYERSRTVMAQYEDIDLFIDLHRNMSNARNAVNDVVTLDNTRMARLFFVVGTGIVMGDTSGETENWLENYTLALSLTERLNRLDAGLARPIRVKQRVYNQDVGLSLLVEIGHNGNRLADAAHTIPALADALKDVCTF